MNLHERRLGAMERLISNPSPAVVAYLRNYRSSLDALKSDDESVFQRAIESGMAHWGELTSDEQALISKISREN